MELSVGKRRGLSSCSTDRGVFSILALDHRNNLRKAINPQAPEKVTGEVLADFKNEVVKGVGSSSSAILLDPEFGAAQIIQDNSMSGGQGLIMSLEATGYVGDPIARKSRILPEWSVGKIRRMGASALKFLIYYHPDSKFANEQEALIGTIANSCKEYDLAFFLEILSYSLDPGKKLSSDQKHDVVIRSAERLTQFKVDVLKAEFPINVKEDSNESHWAKACEELSQASNVPWVLLSAGVDFDLFFRQLTVACQSGASGAMAGRAVWKEAIDLLKEDSKDFLQDVAAVRMRRLTNLCQAMGKPWQDFYPKQQVSEAWYKDYQDI
jgi:tagatose 1,6-diphosphate aldolase